MDDKSGMQLMSDRATQLINAVTDAIMTTVEVAAEKINLAAQVASINQRLTVFSAVLEGIAVQKTALATKLGQAKGPMKALVERQIALLEVQELAILGKVGVPEQVAVAALGAAKTEVVTVEATTAPTHRRDGRRFTPVNGTAGAKN